MQIPRAAMLPTSALGSLADLRNHRELCVVMKDDRAWIVWESPDPSLVHRLMAIPDSRLFSREPGGWTPLGHRLPSFGLPFDAAEMRSLVHEIIPAPLEPIGPRADAGLAPVAMRLVRDDSARAKPATALMVGLESLALWADSAVSSAFDRLSAATSGCVAIVRGSPLPPIVEAARFWGNRVLFPLGWRPSLSLPESTLLRGLNVAEDHLLIFHGDDAPGYEIAPLDAFLPMCRASARLALAGGGRP